MIYAELQLRDYSGASSWQTNPHLDTCSSVQSYWASRLPDAILGDNYSLCNPQFDISSLWHTSCHFCNNGRLSNSVHPNIVNINYFYAKQSVRAKHRYFKDYPQAKIYARNALILTVLNIIFTLCMALLILGLIVGFRCASQDGFRSEYGC